MNANRPFSVGRLVLVLSILAVVAVACGGLFYYGPALAANFQSAPAETVQITQTVAVPAVVTETRIVTQTVAVPAVVTETRIVTQTVAVPAVVTETYASVWNFNGSLPAFQDLRAAVREPGDNGVFRINFVEAFESVTILRAVADDTLTRAEYHSADGAVYDLLSLLQMNALTAGGTGDPLFDAYMSVAGADIRQGEILLQNFRSIFLGNVTAGSYLVFEVMDDVNLQVNRGLFLSLTADTFVFTVDLNGQTVSHPTFEIIPAGATSEDEDPSPTPAP